MSCAAKESDSSQPLLRCSRCKQAYFCNRSCQKESWPIHKQYCKQLVSDDYAVTPRSTKIDLGVGVGVGTEARRDNVTGKVSSFAPSVTENAPFLHLLLKNAHVNVKEKYGFDPFSEAGQASISTCALNDDSPTDDVPKLIMKSIMNTMEVDESLIPGVLVLTEEDDKYYLMIKNGRKYVKTSPQGAASQEELLRTMYSVVKVKFAMGNSSVKLMQFFRQPQNAQTLLAKNKRTIAMLKRHLEKNAEATDEVISCPMRGTSRVYEGYLDMQNLD